MTIDEQIKELEEKNKQSTEKFRQEYYPNIPSNAFMVLQDFLFFIGD